MTNIYDISKGNFDPTEMPPGASLTSWPVFEVDDVPPVKVEQGYIMHRIDPEQLDRLVAAIDRLAEALEKKP